MNDEECLNDAIGRILAVRSFFHTGSLGEAFETAMKALTELDISRIDAIIAAKAHTEFAGITHRIAREHAKEIVGDQLDAEVEAIGHLRRDRVIQLRDLAKSRLQRLSGKKNGPAVVSRPGDFTRKMNDMIAECRATSSWWGRKDFPRRSRDTEIHLDGFVVLISNTAADIQPVVYRGSISIAAGVIAG